MRRYFHWNLQAALSIWGILVVQILATSILYATLSIVGVPENSSLLIAFVALIVLILLGLPLIPKTFRNLKARDIPHADNRLTPGLERLGRSNSSLQQQEETRPSLVRYRIERGLAVLVVVVIIVASLVVFRFPNFPVASFPNYNATATAQANASATAQAGVSATATAQANASASAQANATATAQAKANATAIGLNPNPYPPYRGTLVFNDPLSNNSLGNNWEDYDSGVSACRFTGGAYHLRESKNGYFNDCFPNSNPNFSDFTYQVQMQIISGDCGGIIFRADATHTKFYFFRICQDGSYALYLYVDNTNANAQTVTSGTSSAINTGLDQTNVIAVVAQGNTLNLYVNQQIITSAIDSTDSVGHIAVVAQDQGNPTEVAFSNAKVWAL